MSSSDTGGENEASYSGGRNDGRRQNGARLAPAGAGFQPCRFAARRMLACRAKREQTTVGSRGYTLLSRWMRVRDGSLGKSFGTFLFTEKSTYLSPLARRERMLFFTERKASKELQAYRLTVCATGSGSMAAMKDGIHARGARVIRQPPPLSQASRRRALTRRAPCACGRRLPSGNHFPHGGWWPVRASRALQHLSSRGYALPSRSMGV